MSNDRTTIEDITKEEAAAALRGAAYRVDDLDSDDHGRLLIHTFLGGLGADWDLDAALRTLSKADRVAWVDHIFGHDLGVESGGKAYYFDVKRPGRES